MSLRSPPETLAEVTPEQLTCVESTCVHLVPTASSRAGSEIVIALPDCSMRMSLSQPSAPTTVRTPPET